MKIAVIVGGLSGRGGMETVITSLINEYNAAYSGDNMKLFIRGVVEDNHWLAEIDRKHYSLLHLVEDSKARRYMKYLTSASKSIREYNPDIILAADVRSVLYAKMLYPFLKKKPKIASWIHFSLTSIKSRERRIIKLADFHLAISNGLKQEYLDFTLTDGSNVYTIYNPVKTDYASLKRPEDRAHFLYIGRLIYDGQKRVNDLLMALSKVIYDWRLTVVGDGADRNKLEKLAIDLGIQDKISWLGWKKDPWESIDEATALLLTSEYEGLGMVLLEAMSRGISCISSNCPVGPSDIIKNDENGWLYPIRNIDALSDLLNQVINKEIKMPDQNSIKQSVEKYDVRNYIENLNVVFKKVLEDSDK